MKTSARGGFFSLHYHLHFPPSLIRNYVGVTRKTALPGQSGGAIPREECKCWLTRTPISIGTLMP